VTRRRRGGKAIERGCTFYYHRGKHLASTELSWWTTCLLVLGRSLVGMLVAVGRRRVVGRVVNLQSSTDSISTAAKDAQEVVYDIRMDIYLTLK
jgi:hypothetical protein